MSTTSQSLKLPDRFFPSPTVNSPAAPKLFPGVSAESQSELANLLRQNNEKWHIFFNDRGFHNHLAHHLFAVYAFGTSLDVLTAAYKLHSEYQKPAFASRGPIDASNWKSNLGKWDYYNAYMHFYASEIDSTGPEKTLEKYIFSKEANLTEDGKLGAQMLNRFVSGLLHPMIHSGHWAEFGVPGMLAEGLALTSITKAQTPEFFPPDFFELDASNIASTLENPSLSAQQRSSPIARPQSVPALTILARMLKDDRLAAGAVTDKENDSKFTTTARNAGSIIREYASQWQIHTPDEISERLEEVSWLATIVYGLGGWRKGHHFRSDFFLLHLVTSSIFLPSIISQVPFYAQSEMLRAHLVTTLAWWVSRGRPAIDVASYYEPKFDPWTLMPKALAVKPNVKAVGADDKGTSANMWMPIVESALHHPEEHLIKNQRSLAHFDVMYGATPQGFFEGKTELEGAELLDGTLFWRVALHTQKALGWVREGEEPGEFERAGLGWDELWE